ncbi:MAG: hypothetical protein HXY49_09415 [Ignavibacteriaceae bacterium]|jgi:uncharacterized protein YoxC|nr:hypothetical protein [Ignavibacteriaceae bacterium]
MDLITVFTIVLLISASALCLALILYLGKITRSVKEIESNVRQLSSDLKPLLISSTTLSEKIIRLADEARSQISSVQGIVKDIRGRVDKILSLEEKIRSGFETPLNSLLKNLTAISSGFEAFWNTYKRK